MTPLADGRHGRHRPPDAVQGGRLLLDGRGRRAACEHGHESEQRGVPHAIDREAPPNDEGEPYDAWERRAPCPRARHDAALTDRIIRIGRKRVERLMRRAGLSGQVRRRRGKTTISVQGVRTALDLVARDFNPAINRLSCTDITYIRTWEGWPYQDRGPHGGLRLHRGVLQPPARHSRRGMRFSPGTRGSGCARPPTSRTALS